MAKVKMEVAHPKLFMRGNSGLQQLKEGTVLTLDQAQANVLLAQGRVRPVNSAGSMDLSSKSKKKEEPDPNPDPKA